MGIDYHKKRNYRAINTEELQWAKTKIQSQKELEYIQKWLSHDMIRSLRNKNNNNKQQEISEFFLETQKFSKELKLEWLTKEEKNEILYDLADEIIARIYNQQIEHFQEFIKLRNEILKNAKDHSESNANLFIKITKDPNNTNKWTLYFNISDNWPGIDTCDDETIKNLFVWTKKEWEKKGETNAQVWLNIIWDNLAIGLNIDLILHNKWKIYHINDLWLQKNTKAREKFGYEGVTEITYT